MPISVVGWRIGSEMAAENEQPVIVLSSDSDEDISINVDDESPAFCGISDEDSSHAEAERLRRRQHIRLLRELHRLLPSSLASGRAGLKAGMASRRFILREAIEYIGKLTAAEARSQLIYEKYLQEHSDMKLKLKKIQKHIEKKGKAKLSH